MEEWRQMWPPPPRPDVPWSLSSHIWWMWWWRKAAHSLVQLTFCHVISSANEWMSKQVAPIWKQANNEQWRKISMIRCAHGDLFWRNPSVTLPQSVGLFYSQHQPFVLLSASTVELSRLQLTFIELSATSQVHWAIQIDNYCGYYHQQWELVYHHSGNNLNERISVGLPWDRTEEVKWIETSGSTGNESSAVIIPAKAVIDNNTWFRRRTTKAEDSKLW